MRYAFFSSFIRGAFIYFFVVCLSFSLTADIFTVISLNDAGSGTLRQQIQDAQPGDTIQFSLTGMIEVDSQIVIDKPLFLVGQGAGRTIISGKQLTRIMLIATEDTVSISGFTFEQGQTVEGLEEGGGAIKNLGSLVLTACVFRENKAVFGGAIEQAAFADSAYLYLENCAFIDNQATIPSANIVRSGGAVFSNGQNGGKSLIEAFNCTFSGNHAFATGGAIYLIGDMQAQGTKLYGTNCTIANNSADRVGGIDNHLTGDRVWLKNTILAGNLGQNFRPDMYGKMTSLGHNIIGNDGFISYTAQPTDFINVDAELGPLGLNGNALPTHSLRCGSLAIDSGDDLAAPVIDQRGQGRIGVSDIGAHERDESVDLKIMHTGDSGGGSLRQALELACPGTELDLSEISGTIRLATPLELIQDVVIKGNSQRPLSISGEDSIRIFTIMPEVKAEIEWLSLRKGNPANFGGGAIQNKGRLQLSHCTLYNNHAQSGGAIANYGDGDTATLDMINCTLSGNQATLLDGGAIDNRNFSHPALVQLIHCTLANNRATNKGGGLYIETSAEVEMANTLIAGNKALEGPDIYGKVISLGHNLIGNSANNILSGGSQDLVDLEPEIDALDNWGGPTFTHRLQPGSSAIDAGNNSFAPTSDQRGEARIFNSLADIGAYEYDPATRIDETIPLPVIKVFPNPNHGIFSLSYGSDRGIEQDQLEVLLYNYRGQIIFRQRLHAAALISGTTITLPKISPGIYFLRIPFKDRQISKKIIIE